MNIICLNRFAFITAFLWFFPKSSIYSKFCMFVSYRFHLHWRFNPPDAHSHSVHRSPDGRLWPKSFEKLNCVLLWQWLEKQFFLLEIVCVVCLLNIHVVCVFMSSLQERHWWFSGTRFTSRTLVWERSHSRPFCTVTDGSCLRTKRWLFPPFPLHRGSVLMLNNFTQLFLFYRFLLMSVKSVLRIILSKWVYQMLL